MAVEPRGRIFERLARAVGEAGSGGSSSGRRPAYARLATEAAAELRDRLRPRERRPGRLRRAVEGLAPVIDGGAPLLALILPIVLIKGAIEGIRNQREFDRLAAGGSERICFGCGYDVRDIPRPIPPEVLGGLDAGPAKCPECGAAWPLVPPRPGETGYRVA